MVSSLVRILGGLRLSGTVSSALQARSSLPDLDIRVVDTRSVGPGHANAVEAAVAVRDRGGVKVVGTHGSLLSEGKRLASLITTQ